MGPVLPPEFPSLLLDRIRLGGRGRRGGKSPAWGLGGGPGSRRALRDFGRIPSLPGPEGLYKTGPDSELTEGSGADTGGVCPSSVQGISPPPPGSPSPPWASVSSPETGWPFFPPPRRMTLRGDGAEKGRLSTWLPGRWDGALLPVRSREGGNAPLYAWVAGGGGWCTGAQGFAWPESLPQLRVCSLGSAATSPHPRSPPSVPSRS